MNFDNYNYDNNESTKELNDNFEDEFVDPTELTINLNEDEKEERFSLLFDQSSDEYIDKFISTTKNFLIKGNLNSEMYDNLKKTFKKIILMGNLDDVILFSKNNLEFLQEKEIKIMKCKDDDINQEDYSKLMTLKEILPQAEILIKGNMKYVSILAAQDTMDYINNVTSIVNKKYLSPLEKIMVYYDIVRENIYKKEDEGEDPSLSRDLTVVIKGNKIVCSGYAKVLQALLDASNIRNYVQHLKGDTKGHARNLVYVDDNKYNVHGLYFIDATFDRKREDTNYDYRNIMPFFARSYDEIKQMENNKYEYMEYNLFGSPSLDNNSIKDITVGICNILRLIGIEADIFKIFNSSDEKISALINQIYEYSHKPISKQTFIQLLYNVRKFEYSLNKDYGRFTKTDIEEAFESRYMCTETEATILLKRIFDENYIDNDELFDTFFENTDFNHEYLKIQLAQLLNEVKNNKEQLILKKDK